LVIEIENLRLSWSHLLEWHWPGPLQKSTHPPKLPGTLNKELVMGSGFRVPLTLPSPLGGEGEGEGAMGKKQ